VAVVRDVDDDGAVVDLNPDTRLAGGRVAQHVRQSFLDDAVPGVADGCGQRGRHADHVEIYGEARGLHARDEVGQAGQILDGVKRGRSLLRSAQRPHGGPQLGERLGRGGRYLIQCGGLGMAGLTFAARSGGSLDVDGH